MEAMAALDQSRTLLVRRHTALEAVVVVTTPQTTEVRAVLVGVETRALLE